MNRIFHLVLRASFALLTAWSTSAAADPSVEPPRLSWHTLPALPDELGVAGPFAGVHNDALIVAGGANFPQPVWENDKLWHDNIYVLTRNGGQYAWRDGGKLPRPIAYGAAVSTTDGVVCMGGNDATSTFQEVFLLSWDPQTATIRTTSYPSLPKPCCFGAAALCGQVIYLAGGQEGPSLESAMTNFWALDLSKRDAPGEFQWHELPPWPGPSRALNLTVHQRNGPDQCIYVISGRRQRSSEPGDIEFLKDVWEFTPASSAWRRRSDAPRCVMAGPAVSGGTGHIVVLGGADGSLFFQGNTLRDAHPGFPKQALAYHPLTDTWVVAGAIPANHVTTMAVRWGNDIIVPSGEVRPRVRSPQVFRVVNLR